MILYNPNDVQALVTDNHWVPSVHVNFTTGPAIKADIDSAGAGRRRRSRPARRSARQGSVMADFSSRGPNRAARTSSSPTSRHPA